MDLATLRTALATELSVLEKLGEGGEGTVFLCRTLVTEERSRAGERPREVALKLLHSPRGRPLLEAALGLRHPHVVATLATGQVLGRPWVLMEYFPGKPLRTRLGRPLPATELRAVLEAVASALEHAHAHGVVHQDVKPENVLVREGEDGRLEVKLADFGLAAEVSPEERQALLASRSVRSSSAEDLRTLAGTLPYLAPERLEEPPPAPHPRVDVYSLGVLLFEALTGRPPGGLELPSELRPDLDPGWDRVLKRALARDPARRFASIPELAAESLLLLGRRDAPAPQAAPGKRAWRRAPAVEREPDDLVAIPAGTFRMGERSDPDASPVRVVTLAAFLVDRTPVTNAAYYAFVLETGARPPSAWARRGVPPRRLPAELAPLPVAGVTWDDAAAFAAWSGKRLPTEAEWERVARGRSGRAFPYGERLDLARIHAGGRALGPVRAHPEGQSDEGVLDLTGNAWEWCADWFGPYDPGETVSPLGPARGEARVIRGGHDPARPASGSAWFRGLLRPDVASSRVGFRCVRSPL